MVIKDLVLHSPHLPAMGLRLRHTSLVPRKSTNVQSSRCRHNSSPASPGVRAQGRRTHTGVTAIAVLEKNCLVSQSRHLRPSSRFAESAKRNAQGGWLPIVADKGKVSFGLWKYYVGTGKYLICRPIRRLPQRLSPQNGDFCALYHTPFNQLTAIICNNLCFRCSGYAWP